ncbi:hypothetical protein FQA39_LY18793 [Lamprigera yunnana]|nr:hypothetical protein FQA39_LY18793 [Lamprigera yunnana]
MEEDERMLVLFKETLYGGNHNKTNRFYDKTIQMVLSNNLYGYCFEHSPIDGTVTAVFDELLQKRRVDCIRSATIEALEWAKVMVNATTNSNLKFSLWQKAIRAQVQETQDVISGQGIDVHLVGLREAAKETNMSSLPELFTDKSYDIANHFVLSSSQTGSIKNIIPGFGPTTLLRVTVDGGTNQWLSWIKWNYCEEEVTNTPDLITGDMDSVSKESLDYFTRRNKSLKIIETPDQNETDFTKALREVHSYSTCNQVQIDNIVVVVDSSGRFDQILANIQTLFKADEIVPNINVFY